MRTGLPRALGVLALLLVPIPAPLGATEAPLPLAEALRRDAGEKPWAPRGWAGRAGEWLPVHQRADGSWGAADFDRWRLGAPFPRPAQLSGLGEPAQDTLVTALSACAYLGAGHTHQGRHPQAVAVRRALEWLLAHQDGAGHFRRPGQGVDPRTQAVATLALTEVTGMTDDPLFLGAAQRGLERLLATQSDAGAWEIAGKPDLLSTAWSVMALRSMQLIDEDRLSHDEEPLLGLDPDHAFARARAWLEAGTDAKTGVLRIEGERHPLLSTAIGTLLRIMTGEDPQTSRAIRAAGRLLAEHPPTADATKPASDQTYTYYGTLAAFQIGDSTWKVWSEGLKRAVVDVQVRTGSVLDLRGSWHPRGRWCRRLGRGGSTALMMLCLEVYYRYDKTFGDEGGVRHGRIEPARGTWHASKLAPHALRFEGRDGNALPVPAARVTAEIHGTRARVVLGIRVENPHKFDREGRIQLRLPDGAAPYFLSLGAWMAADRSVHDLARPVRGDLASLRAATARTEGSSWEMCDARMARTARARKAYTEIVNRRRDPALLTWAGAGVFNLGVFPLQPGRLHRIVLAYEVDLVPIGGDLELRLGVPDDAGKVVVTVNTNGAEVSATPAGRPEKGRLRWDDPKVAAIRALVPDPGDVALVGRHEAGASYYAAWLRPWQDEGPPLAAASKAVILVDTSRSIESVRLTMRRRLLEQLLESNRPDLTAFALATFDTEPRWWRDGFVENTPENVAAAVEHITTHEPQGATDLEAALRAASKLEGPCDVFLLSDGAPSWGERGSAEILAAHDMSRRIFAYRTGPNDRTSALLETITARTNGALAPVLGERDVAPAARAHRHRVQTIVRVHVAGVEDLFLAGDVRTLHHGQRILVVGRKQPKTGARLALSLADAERSTTLRVDLPTPFESEMAARVYDHAAASILEAIHEPEDGLAWAYAAHFRVVRPAAALVMLETEKDYLRYGIGEPNTRAQMWAHPVRDTLAKVEAPTVAPAAQGWARINGLLQTSEFACVLPDALGTALAAVDTDRLDVPQSSVRELGFDLEADEVASGLEDARDETGALLAAAFVAWDAGWPDQAYRSLLAAWNGKRFSRTRCWTLARLADQLGRFELAIAWYEIALGRRGQDGQLIDVIALDYSRFLRHVEAGRKPVAIPAFSTARARSLVAIHPIEHARHIVLFAPAGSSRRLSLAIESRHEALHGRYDVPPHDDAFFVHSGSGGMGVDVLVVPEGKYGPPKLRVLGPRGCWRDRRVNQRTRRPDEPWPPAQVLVTLIDDWGLETERTTHHRIVVRDAMDVKEVPSG